MDPRLDTFYMLRALELARQGQGYVEPNPMVGCVVVRDDHVIGEGWHAKFGEAHAEVVALARCGAAAKGSTLYVTFEPCCHHGKTPPCTDAIIRSGVTRVVVAMRDPFGQVDGRGIDALRKAGIGVEIGVLEDDARDSNAPYLKLLSTARPWVIAKWAMTLDGKIATRTGASRWISSEAARSTAQRLRGRVDAVVIGSRTALADDPLLTARPSGPRRAVRVVLDTEGRLPSESQLVRTAHEVPVVVAVGASAAPAQCARLASAGCEVVHTSGASQSERIDWLLGELGRRSMTNVLVEGGGRVLGALLDAGQIDEVHAFIAAKLVGGSEAPTAIAGEGVTSLAEALRLHEPVVELLGGDIYVHGQLRPAPSSP